MHTLTHPGPKLGSRADAIAELETTEAGDATELETTTTGAVVGEDVDVDVLAPIIERPSVVKANVTAEELMARLADEDDDESDDIAVERVERVAVSKHGA